MPEQDAAVVGAEGPNDTVFPIWTTTLFGLLESNRAVVIYGNINDLFPGRGDRPVSLEKVVAQRAGAARGETTLVVDISAQESRALNGLDDEVKRTSWTKAEKLVEAVGVAIAQLDNSNLVIFTGCQVAFSRVEEWQSADWQLHARLLQRMASAPADQRFMFVFPDEGRVPANFLANQPRTRRLLIDTPSQSERHSWLQRRPAVIDRLIGDDGSRDINKERRFIALSEELRWEELEAIAEACDRGRDPLTELRRMRVGAERDRWGELLDHGLRHAMDRANADTDDDKIYGQDEAERRALQVLAKAALNLSEGLNAAYNKPRGVMFFVGPTGVGKTMLAKKLAKIVFGDEQACLNFDMSEYSQESSEARLVGAPPGFVGYDAGGQLTQRVRSKPFSVVVFDEIDKADPAILTKFLQILDEGRLTDGKGQTTFFSETLIIFTSNHGATAVSQGNGEITVDGHPVKISRASDYAHLARFYRQQLSQLPVFEKHPEILSRIGVGNIVPFQHIASAEAVGKLVKTLLARTVSYVESKRGRTIHISDGDYEALVDMIVRRADWQTFGMRNVQQSFESIVIEPLSLAMLRHSEERGFSIAVSPEGLTIVPRNDGA